MKKHLMIISTALTILATSTSFADTQPNKTPQLKDLGSAFKSHSTIAPKIDPKDITMGYAGQDVVNRRPIITF